MDHNNSLVNFKVKDGDICLVDSTTTYTILCNKKYLFKLTLSKASVNTILGPVDLIESSGKANMILPQGTKLLVKNALYSSRSNIILLSFKDIHRNGYHIKMTNEGGIEYLSSYLLYHARSMY